jgi:hypothetical protein
MLYLPSSQHTPLYIRTSTKDTTKHTGFIVPRWGSVVVFNNYANGNHSLNPSFFNMCMYVSTYMFVIATVGGSVAASYGAPAVLDTSSLAVPFEMFISQVMLMMITDSSGLLTGLNVYSYDLCWA